MTCVISKHGKQLLIHLFISFSYMVIFLHLMKFPSSQIMHSKSHLLAFSVFFSDFTFCILHFNLLKAYMLLVFEFGSIFTNKMAFKDTLKIFFIRLLIEIDSFYKRTFLCDIISQQRYPSLMFWQKPLIPSPPTSLHHLNP